VAAHEADAKRPKRERHTAKMLLEQMRAAAYEGGYTRLTDFIRGASVCAAGNPAGRG
jgi:hypothetical protein